MIGTKAVLSVLAVVCVAACSKHEFEPPDREERMAEADDRFSAIVWDTVSWESAEQRALEGNGVWAARCRNCHGTLGQGGTEYAVSRGLDVPSLVEPDWPMAAELDSVRHRIFVGHTAGMPTWGVAGIDAYEIDAVAHYLLDQLRPEVLGGR